MSLSRRRFLALCAATAAGGCARGPSRPRSLPRVTAAAVTRWTEDPFSLGAYSFLRVGATPEDRQLLAAPVGGRVHFAGEATHPEFPGTLHGAILSGRRAAEEAMAASDGRVVVIGGGAAGVAAAARLQQAGRPVVVIEARSRLGGRAHTDLRTFGAPVDLGAAWIHGVRGNPLSALADQLGLGTTPFDWDDAVAYDERGRAIGADLDALLEEVPLRPGRSVADAVARSPVADARHVDLALASLVEHELGADADELDGAAWDEGEELAGGDHLLTVGLQALIEGAAEGIEVRFRHVVDEVALLRRGVEVRTTSGVLPAAAVVVTVPLGVLQTGRPRFSPPLPAEKQAAIARLGSGALAKAVLRFESVFWDDAAVIQLGDRRPRTQWTEFVNLEPTTGEPILVGFSAGHAGRVLESAPRNDVVASALAALWPVYT